MGSYASDVRPVHWPVAQQSNHQNHNNLQDNGGYMLIKMKQMRTKASKLFVTVRCIYLAAKAWSSILCNSGICIPINMPVFITFLRLQIIYMSFLILNGTAKTKLTILAFLCWGEIVNCRIYPGTSVNTVKSRSSLKAVWSWCTTQSVYTDHMRTSPERMTPTSA